VLNLSGSEERSFNWATAGHPAIRALLLQYDDRQTSLRALRRRTTSIRRTRRGFVMWMTCYPTLSNHGRLLVCIEIRTGNVAGLLFLHEQIGSSCQIRIGSV
jgi:hypothetical protein